MNFALNSKLLARYVHEIFLELTCPRPCVYYTYVMDCVYDMHRALEPKLGTSNAM